MFSISFKIGHLVSLINTNFDPRGLNPQPEHRYPMEGSTSVPESPVWQLGLLLEAPFSQRWLLGVFIPSLTIFVFKNAQSICIYCNYSFLPPYFTLSMYLTFYFFLSFFLPCFESSTFQLYLFLFI